MLLWLFHVRYLYNFVLMEIIFHFLLILERGKDWEHCFMFGDSSTVIKKGININSNSKTGSVGEDKPSGSIRSQRPPTW